MQVYFYLPIGKILFYIFTIVFHSYLLAKAALGSRFFLAALLVIPVIAVTLVMIKFLRNTAIRVITHPSSMEIVTLFQRLSIRYPEVDFEGKFLKTGAGDFRIFPSKAGLLHQQLKSRIQKENGPGS